MVAAYHGAIARRDAPSLRAILLEGTEGQLGLSPGCSTGAIICPTWANIKSDRLCVLTATSWFRSSSPVPSTRRSGPKSGDVRCSQSTLATRPHHGTQCQMTGDRFRARADECINAAHAVTDPVRKLALMDVAQRWLRLAAQIDGEQTQRRRLDHSFGPTQEGPTSA